MSQPLATPTQNYLMPSNGVTHAVSFQDTLSATNTEYDFRSLKLDQYPFTPQGAFIDNSANATAAVLVINPIGYRVVVPAGFSAAVNFPAPKNLVIEATGGGEVPITFVDFPVLPQMFSASGGAMPVTIPAVPSGANGYSIIQQPAPLFVANGNTALTNSGAIGAPPANANLRKLILEITANATLAAAGELGLIFNLNGNLIYETSVYIGAGFAGWSKVIDFDSIAPNVGGAGTLSVTFSGGLTAGHLVANAYYD